MDCDMGIYQWQDYSYSSFFCVYEGDENDKQLKKKEGNK